MTLYAEEMAKQETNKRYGQLCPVATGSDAVGDRWTLLLLRDLAHGPLRFGELADSNPGISPSVLTKRLGRLEGDGLVEVIKVGERGQKRYQLNSSVQDRILSVLDAVSQLGIALTPEGPITSQQLVDQFASDRAWFLAKHHRTEGVFAFHIEDANIGLVVDQYTFEPSVELPKDPTAVVTASNEAMMRVNTLGLSVDDAIAEGIMSVDGDLDAVRNFFTALAAPYAGAN